MAYRSLAIALSAMAATASAQSQGPSALPDITGGSNNACGGCYVVADIAGVVFGGVQTQTQTNVVSVGRNGSQTTTFVQNNGKATFVSNAPVPGPPTSFHALSSVITVNGATLTSPTSYEVFTAYSVTRTVQGADGSCSVSSGTPSVLPQASSYIVSDNPGTDALLQIESSFISDIGFPSCSAGGGNVQSTVHSMLTTETQHLTTTGINRPTPVAVSVQPTSTAGPTGSSGSSPSNSVVIFSNSTAAGAPSGTGAGSGGATFTISPAINAAVGTAPSWVPGAAAMICGALLLRWL